jgi:DNA helicase-2/ATP-dependent DNA helicase PcrA
MSDDPLLRGLDPTQREAVTSGAKPLGILAGAGSGKTRVVTRRIAWRARERSLDAGHVLAVTFTRKAAGELRERLARLGVSGHVTAGTFHAVALGQLRQHARDTGRAAPVVLERKARLLVPLLPARGRDAGLAAAEVASEIEWAKARLVAPGDYEAAVTLADRTPPRPAAEVASIYRAYEREKRKRGVVDFDDLIHQCADTLERDPAFGDAQRWRFRHLFVDEFQDASAAQFRLLRAWLGDRDDLCVVGDGDQAVYGFAGADPTYLTRFTAVFPRARYPDVAVVALGCNYRSSPQIVAAAGAVLGAGGRHRRPPRASRPDGPEPTVTAYESDDAEARGVATALRAAHQPGTRWSRSAVLYRVNAQSALLEEALARAGVPFRVRGGQRFVDRAEVRVALDTLRELARAAPTRPFSEHLTDLAAEPEGSEERREHVDALVRLGHEYLETEGSAGVPSGSVDGFVGFLHATLRGEDADASTGGDAVELLTFHRAKGLEFDTVFVTGVERGLVPISHARTPAALDEEQRLLYVAVSRAERALHVSWARHRTVGARVVGRRPSPWLARIERAVAPPTTEGPGDARAAIADARDRVTRAGGRAARDRVAVDAADTGLLDALVEWRRKLSRAANVPAYVIFANSTLAEIASARPSSHRALLAVNGVGPVKAERYGDDVLGIVASSPTPPAAPRAGSRGITGGG